MMSFHFNGLSSYWILGILFMLLLAYIVFRDANSRGENGTLWFFIVLIFPMMGFFFYLIILAINRGDNRRNTSSSNNSNLGGSTPPTVESVRTRQSPLDYDNKTVKPNKQQLSEFQFCTNCGFQNTLEASFCKGCGIKLSVGDY